MAAQQSGVVIEPKLVVDTALKHYLGPAHPGQLPDPFQDFIDGQHERFFRLRLHVERAEIALTLADVGEVDIDVDHEGDAVVLVDAFFRAVCQPCRDTQGRVQTETTLRYP